MFSFLKCLSLPEQSLVSSSTDVKASYREPPANFPNKEKVLGNFSRAINKTPRLLSGMCQATYTDRESIQGNLRSKLIELEGILRGRPTQLPVP